jgi:hypothetical protein
VIPFLANATKPTALEFKGAECDVDASDTRMTCEGICFLSKHSPNEVNKETSATFWNSPLSSSRADSPQEHVDVVAVVQPKPVSLALPPFR